MPCPDEDTFARFVEGLLPPESAAEIERHVDGCAGCADLAAAFGRSFSEAPTPPAAPPRRLAPLALAVAAVLHVAWAVAMRGAADALERIVPGPLTGAYLGYATIWAPLGGVIALTAAFCLLRQARPGRVLAFGYALLSLPSIVLTPLALLLLGAEQRDQPSS
jgi:multidrug transporter EmrE-like cation transporter